MKISVDEIPQTPKEIDFSESVEELNHLYNRQNNQDFGFPPTLDVYLEYSRSGADLFFRGRLRGQLTARCGRCLEEFDLPLDRSFDFILTPENKTSDHGAEELRREDLGLSHYSSDEIDLAPLIAEQVMLALPTRPLCGENCRGLCDQCGANLNRDNCNCSNTGQDPRMAPFRSLKVGR